MGRYLKVSNEDGTYTDLMVYDEIEIMEFAEWTSDNYWNYVKQNSNWINVIKQDIKTTAQLLEEWQIWKEGKNG